MIMKRKSPADKLSAEIEALRSEQEAAAIEVATLRASRTDLLLSGSDDDVRRLDDAIATAERRRDRAAARIEQAEEQLAVMQAQAAKDEQAALEKEADSAANAAAKLVADNLAKIRTLVHDTLHAIAQADQKVLVANLTRDGDLLPLHLTESRVRRKAPVPKKIISKKVISAWCYEASGDRLPADSIGRVQDQGGGRGRLYPVGMSNNFHPVVKRQFQRVEYLPAVVPPSYVKPLAQALAVPGLRAGDVDIWQPLGSDDPDIVLRTLAELADQSEQDEPQRKAQVEFIPLDAAEDAAAA